MAGSTAAVLVMIAVIAACAGSGAVVSGPVAPGPDPSVDRDGDGLPDDLELGLLRQYRPYWEFDPAEEIWPISVEEWADLGGALVDTGGALTPYQGLPVLVSSLAAVPAGSHEAMLTVDAIHPGLPMCEGTGARPGCNDAPTFVDAQPMPAGFCLEGRCGLVWLHFWLLWHADLKRLGGREVVHFGDWEHLCALVEADAHGDLAREPVAIHWHHHGAADIATGSEALAYRADAFGVRHPVAFVEALSHGIWEKPDPSAGRGGGGSPDNPLDNPLVFMTGHPASLDDPTNEVLGRFTGRWGQSDRSPIGPLQFNSRCDHDYPPRPSGSDWAQEGC